MTNHIALPVAELKTALSGFNKIIGKRSTLPVLGCLKVDRDAEGAVSLQATNLDDIATYQIKEVSDTEPLSFLVPFEPLAKIIKGASSKDYITLADEGKKGLKLRSFLAGNMIDQPLERIDLKEWPPVPTIRPTVIKLDKSFTDAFQQAFECASEDGSRVILNGVCLDVSDKKSHYVVSTNARALFSANSFAFDLPKSIVIPSHKFLGWSGWMETEESWLSYQPGKNKDAGWIQIRNGNWTINTKEVEGQYPNWRNIIPAKPPKVVIQLNEAAVGTLLEVLPKLPGNQEMNSPITLKVQGSKLTVEARDKDQDKPTIIPIPQTILTGRDMVVTINRDYLIRALKFGLTELTYSDPTGAENPVLVCQSDGRKLLIALLGEAKDQPTPASSGSTASTAAGPETRPEQERTTEMAKTETRPVDPKPALIDQVENIKETLKTVIRDLNTLVDSVKQAEKDQRATEKEVESARATLKKLQQVSI